MNLDESSFNDSNPWKKGWVKKGTQVKTMRIGKFSNITLTSIISMEGDHFFTFLKGSNNQFVFVEMLKKLVVQLDIAKPGWREHSVILLDNGPLHTTEYAMDTMKKL